MEKETSLVKYEAACRALADARSTDEVRGIMNKAIAIKAYARQAKNKTLEADAFEIRARAERRLGELMAEMPKAEGTRGQLSGRDASGGIIEIPPESIIPSFAEQGIDKRLAINARRAAALPAEEFEKRVAKAREKIIDAVKGATNWNQSISNDHYTPEIYINAARTVMLGEIDLDPASCAQANEVVKAKQFFTESDNGLQCQWHGRVWLNPPYGGLAGKFIAKLVEEIEARRVSEAIALVSAHSTDTEWFQPLWYGQLCFTNHRIAFSGKAANVGGSVFAYFGPNRAAFIEQFEQFGPIVERIWRMN
jgi:hypothetical protein